MNFCINLKKMGDVDLCVTLFGTLMKSCIYNASGVYCQTLQEMEQVHESLSGAVISKSCTLKHRNGNPHPRYFAKRESKSLLTINSMGLPNGGLDYYLTASKLLPKKPFIISVSGMTLEENEFMVKHILEFYNSTSHTSLSALELNLSCPNLEGKPQTGYDFDQMDHVLSVIAPLFANSPLSFGVKLPPYFDPIHWKQAADVLIKYEEQLSFVTCINSIGNGLVIDVETEQTVIKPKNGFGGIGGSVIKPTALANVRAFYELLPKSIAIIGCGGVMNGKDVFEHILCGATAVQIGSVIKENGVDHFKTILLELQECMRSKGYTSLNDFRGKLRRN